MDPFAPSPVRAVPIDIYTDAYRVSGTTATRFSRVGDIVNQASSGHLLVEEATISEYADPAATISAAQVLVNLAGCASPSAQCGRRSVSRRFG
jgi:hypothetical protein